ncbi:MAG TPA: DUF4397 domain-containing protein [Gemmatimonadaceae bacterium]|jgi:hypothetical protein|nr:DUF4397 domain-containing protein [Gemmatimonadaceae bacterium]
MTIKSTSFIAALALAAVACGTKDAPGPLEAGQTGRIRFVNLITDPARNPVNAILESVPFGVNLAYGGTTPSSLPSPATANYSAILVGDRTLVLQRTADPTVTVATLTFTIVLGNDHTVYAQGGTGGGAVTGFVTTDPTPAPPAGQVAVRIVNMSPTGGAMDFFVTAPNADLSTATPTAANLAYHGQSPYVNLAAGTYQIRAVPAGTAPALRSTSVVITLTPPATPAPFPAGSARTIVAADAAAGGSPLRAFLLTDK